MTDMTKITYLHELWGDYFELSVNNSHRQTGNSLQVVIIKTTIRHPPMTYLVYIVPPQSLSLPMDLFAP